MDLIRIAISTFIFCFGYGIIFNIHGKKLCLVGLGGVVGVVIYELALGLDHGKLTALFLASLGIALYAEIMARVCKCPVTIFVISALIPLVPGWGMYHTMLYAIQGDVYQSLTTGIETISASFVLIMGMLVLTPFIRLIHKGVKNR